MFIKSVSHHLSQGRQVTVVFACRTATPNADGQARIKAENEGGTNGSFGRFWRVLRFNVPFRRRKSKKKEVQISWPQDVVKLLEDGDPLHRVLAIRNSHERIVQKPAGGAETHHVGSEDVGQGSPAAAREGVDASSPQCKRQNQRSPPNGTNSSLADVELAIAPQGQKVNTLGHSTINTDSVREFMSEPRASWRLSAPRTERLVSKVRLVEPEVRVISRTPPSESPSMSKHPDPSETFAQPAYLASVNGQHHEGGKDRPLFVFPNPISVQRRAWMYSVDAEAACNREREKYRYSNNGDGFKDLVPIASITDPEILNKIAAIRLQQQNELPRNDRNRIYHPKQQRPHESVNPTSAWTDIHYHQPPRLNSVEQAMSPNGTPNQSHQLPEQSKSPDINLQAGDPAEASMPNTKLNMREVSQMEMNPSSPLDKTTIHIPHDLRSQHSSLSSNVRTPRSFYGPKFIPHEDRPQNPIVIKPKLSKAAFGLQQRSGVLSRNPPDVLQAKQEFGLGREEMSPDGDLWRTAPIVLGQLTYETITRWRNREGDEPDTPSISPVPSSFNEVPSTTQRPSRPPEKSRSFLPTPSPAVISDRNGHHAPIKPPISKVIENAIQNQAHAGLRYLLNHSTNRISSEDAKDLLYKTIRRPLSAHKEAKRQARLAKSQCYFAPDYKPQKPESIPERMNYVVAAFRDLARETSHPRGLTQADMVYLTRLLSTKEFVPYPIFQAHLRDSLTLFLEAWPIAEDLGLRPLAILHFLHEDVDIITFASTEDDALYLWSPEWDVQVFNAAKLVRAGKTFEDCERGILEGLHVLEFERGGWLKLDGYEDGSSTARPPSGREDEEDIYTHQSQKVVVAIQM